MRIKIPKASAQKKSIFEIERKAKNLESTPIVSFEEFEKNILKDSNWATDSSDGSSSVKARCLKFQSNNLKSNFILIQFV